jgi:nitronate monooxygenase
MEKHSLTTILNIKHPVIMAPMFLVSNTKMVIEGMKSGVAGCIPALNYRTLEELKVAIHELKVAKVPGGSFGFNLIVNKSNVKYKEQLQLLCKEKVDFILTSLGSPEETINEAHKVGIKVFCDVTDLTFAKKVESLGFLSNPLMKENGVGEAGSFILSKLSKSFNSNFLFFTALKT